MTWQQRFVVIFMLLGLLSSPARSQSFPTAEHWAPLPCGAWEMTDGLHDESGAVDERDIVGDRSAPAGYSASDTQFLYLRLRLDEDPAPQGKPRPAAWGFAVSMDSNPRTYELLVLLDGASNTVELYRNTTTAHEDDLQDAPDQPALATYPFATHARSEMAPDSRNGGNSDYLLSLAVPWSALRPLGVTPETPVTVYAASSSNAHGFDGPGGDFACHAEADGAATFSGTLAPRTVLDPALDSDHDGYADWIEVAAGTDPQSAASVPTDSLLTSELELEGGGGCSVARAADSGACAVVLLGLLGLLALHVRRGRRRAR